MLAPTRFAYGWSPAPWVRDRPALAARVEARSHDLLGEPTWAGVALLLADCTALLDSGAVLLPEVAENAAVSARRVLAALPPFERPASGLHLSRRTADSDAAPFSDVLQSCAADLQNALHAGCRMCRLSLIVHDTLQVMEAYRQYARGGADAS